MSKDMADSPEAEAMRFSLCIEKCEERQIEYPEYPSFKESSHRLLEFDQSRGFRSCVYRKTLSSGLSFETDLSLGIESQPLTIQGFKADGWLKDWSGRNVEKVSSVLNGVYGPGSDGSWSFRGQIILLDSRGRQLYRNDRASFIPRQSK